MSTNPRLKVNHTSTVAVRPELARSVVALPTTAAAQTAHQGHQEKGTKQGSHAMTMPALSEEHFVAMMIKHHQDGIELAKLEESKGSRDAVRSLAAEIRANQERELEELQAHESKHGQHQHTGMSGTSGHSAHSSMEQHQQMMETMAKEPLALTLPLRIHCG